MSSRELLVATSVALGIYGCAGRVMLGEMQSVPDPPADDDEQQEDEQEEEEEDNDQQQYLHVCMSCGGSDAALSDLEDLCAWADNVQARAGGCMQACGSGPNCMIRGPATLAEPYGTHDVVTGLTSLAKSRRLVETATKQKLVIPAEADRRMKLRSEATRLMRSNKVEALKRSVELFSQAIECELDGALCPVPPGTVQAPSLRTERVRKLRMLRADTLGGRHLADTGGAIADFDAVIESEPTYSLAHLQKAKVLRRASQSAQALECFRRAHKLGSEGHGEGFSLDSYLLRWVERSSVELVCALCPAALSRHSSCSKGGADGR
jgi:hypothetical protein